VSLRGGITISAEQKRKRIRRGVVELALKTSILLLVVSLPLFLGGVLERVLSTGSPVDVVLLVLLAGSLVALLAMEANSFLRRLSGIRTSKPMLVAYNENIPLSAIRTAFVGTRVVWVDLSSGLRKILYKADFENLDDALRSLVDSGVEVRKHLGHSPPPLSPPDGANS